MAARYTLIVGTKEWSSWSLRPYMALRATGAPFDEIKIRLRQQPLTGDEIKRHSKAGRVPILKIEEDGREVIVWDSLAICETLAERHPEGEAVAGRSAGAGGGAVLCRRDAFGLSRSARPALDGFRAPPALARLARGDPGAGRAHRRRLVLGAGAVRTRRRLPVRRILRRRLHVRAVVSRFTTFGVEVPAPVRGVYGADHGAARDARLGCRSAEGSRVGRGLEFSGFGSRPTSR